MEMYEVYINLYLGLLRGKSAQSHRLVYSSQVTVECLQ